MNIKSEYQKKDYSFIEEIAKKYKESGEKKLTEILENIYELSDNDDDRRAIQSKFESLVDTITAINFSTFITNYGDLFNPFLNDTENIASKRGAALESFLALIPRLLDVELNISVVDREKNQ